MLVMQKTISDTWAVIQQMPKVEKRVTKTF